MSILITSSNKRIGLCFNHITLSSMFHCIVLHEHHNRSTTLKYISLRCNNPLGFVQFKKVHKKCWIYIFFESKIWDIFIRDHLNQRRSEPHCLGIRSPAKRLQSLQVNISEDTSIIPCSILYRLRFSESANIQSIPQIHTRTSDSENISSQRKSRKRRSSSKYHGQSIVSILNI